MNQRSGGFKGDEKTRKREAVTLGALCTLMPDRYRVRYQGHCSLKHQGCIGCSRSNIYKPSDKTQFSKFGYMEREKDWLSKYVDKDELEDFTSQGMQRNGQRLVRERSMSAVHPDANMEIGEEGLTLDSMLFNCFENASLLNKKLPSPLAFKDPLLERFYFESRTSLLLGLETASIVLASCLVEYLLKRACFICRHGKFPSLETLLIWQEEKERKETFDGAINGAYELGLITAEKRDILKEFKDLIRNPYMHSNLFQLTKSSSTTAGIFELPKDATEGAKKFVAEFEASPIWRGLSRNMDSTELAYPLFCFVHDQIVQIREAVTKIID